MFSDVLSYVTPHFDANLTGITLYILLSLMGVIIGVLASLFGVGGGFLLVPVMNILLGIPMEIAAGSATCYIIGTSSTGFIKQIKNKNVELKVFAFIALGSSIGAVLGDIIQNKLMADEKNLQIIFFIILLVIAAVMFFSKERDINKKVLLQRFPIGPRTDLYNAGINGLSIPGLFLIGISGGILTGLLGISGGVLFVPLLVLGVGLTSRIATGTSLGIVLVSSISAVIKKGFSGSGKISLSIALSLLVASAIGVQTGIAIGQKLHSEKLKRYFSIVVLLAAIMVLVKIIHS